MKKSSINQTFRVILFLIILLIVIGVIAFSLLNPNKKEDNDENKIRIGDTPEQRCNKLSLGEKKCCLGSLKEAMEKKWLVLGPDCYYDDLTDNQICLDQTCEEGYQSVVALCKGSLTFCVENKSSILNPVAFSNAE